MSDHVLRKQIIHLAHANPGPVQDALLPLLRGASRPTRLYASDAQGGVSLESFEDISHEVLFLLGDRLQDATSDFVEATANLSPKQAAQQKAALEAVLKTLEDKIKARLQGTRRAIS